MCGQSRVFGTVVVRFDWDTCLLCFFYYLNMCAKPKFQLQLNEPYPLSNNTPTLTRSVELLRNHSIDHSHSLSSGDHAFSDQLAVQVLGRKPSQESLRTARQGREGESRSSSKGPRAGVCGQRGKVVRSSGEISVAPIVPSTVGPVTAGERT
jgi:hypothetical protein